MSNFLPSRRRDCLTTILRLHQPFQNRTIPLAFRRGGARPSRCTEPFRSHNHCKTALSSKSTISLPPLSKVRCCRRKNSGDYRRDCHSTNPPKTAPSLACTITLASLVKGRWIDGKAQTVALLRFACDTSTFLIYQTFCRQDGGIACYKLFQPCRHLR